MPYLRTKVEDACKKLKPIQKRYIAKSILKLTDDIKELTTYQSLVFWLTDWLVGTGIMEVEKIFLFVEHFSQLLNAFSSALEEAKDKDTFPVCRLGILDRQYICLDGSMDYLDLNTGDITTSIKLMPLETIVYNLTTLYTRYSNTLS